MKYIVLSFDDSMLDFKLNALPLLKKFEFKACINTITGFVDKTISSKTQYLSIDDIAQLDKDGFEIAAHSNSHIKPISIKDLEICTKKINQWIGNKPLGVIAPYSKSPDEETVNFITSNYLYFADYCSIKSSASFRFNIIKFFNHFLHSKSRDRIVQNSEFYYSLDYVKRGFTFKRLTANRDNNPSAIIKSIKLMKKNTCLTIVFHSIVRNINDKTEWPYGAWTVDELDNLLHFLKKHKNINVLTQKALFNVKNNQNIY